MKRINPWTIICGSLVLGLGLGTNKWIFSSASQPPSGYTGSPLDRRNCLSCHSGSTINNSTNVSLTGLPAAWQPNTTYSLTVTLNTGTNNGFEVTAENASSKQGTFATGTNSSVLDTAKRFVGQTRASTSINSWSFSYTTPAAGAGTITFWVEGLACNGNGSTSGDNVHLRSYPIPESVVATPPAITAQPANQTVTEGLTATFSVTASGTAPLSYQWQKAAPGSGTFANIAGATAASYTTPATTLADSGSSYQCVVTNSAGSATSNAATLTVNAAPASITTQPTNQTVTTGATASFSVTAAGTVPLGYQWQKAAPGSGTFANIAGATTASYTTPVTTLADSGSSYRCVVTNSAGSATSTAATLTVSATVVAPSITTPPSNQTVTAGAAASFSVTAAGTVPLGYQWQKAAPGSGTFANIAGATAASYTTPATTLADSGSSYRCVATNSAGSATSAAATLTVNAATQPPAIITSPVDQSVTEGQNANFSVTASGSNPLTYQWQSAAPGSTIFSNIAGATQSSYSRPAALADNGMTFSCVVANSAGSATSNAALLSVAPAPFVRPTILIQPADLAVSIGQSATFQVVADGTPPLTYQWYRNGMALTVNASSDTYALLAATAADDGAAFSCLIGNGAGLRISRDAVLRVGTAPATPVFDNLRPFMSLNDLLRVRALYDASVHFNWTFSRTEGLPSVGTAAPAQASTAAAAQAATPSNVISPSSLHLGPGRYHISVAAVSSIGIPSAAAEADVALTSSGLEDARIYPNPWRKDRHPESAINFDHMSAGSRIRIFTVSGHFVRQLEAPSGEVQWDLRNTSGDPVASGIYLYLITNDARDQRHGQLAVIR